MKRLPAAFVVFILSVLAAASGCAAPAADAPADGSSGVLQSSGSDSSSSSVAGGQTRPAVWMNKTDMTYLRPRPASDIQTSHPPRSAAVHPYTAGQGTKNGWVNVKDTPGLGPKASAANRMVEETQMNRRVKKFLPGKSGSTGGRSDQPADQ